MKEFFTYGEKVDGYAVRVVNEREARAGAGLLFAFGLLSLTNSVMLHNIMPTKYFIAFFTLDFLVRVINPSYSPSLLIGRFFVRNQVPEYVGAAQKRFAWLIGFMLALPMFYLIVVHFVPNPLKVLICIICLLLLFSESAFSICLGCMVYNFFNKEKSKNCPGGVCEVRQKDKIQTFSPVQKIIVILSGLLITYGLYAYMTKVENKTVLMKKITLMMMSDAQLKELEDQKYHEELNKFEDEDF